MRDKYISFRVTEKEKTKIKIKAKQSNMNVSDYCFYMAMKGEIKVIDTSGLNKLTKELNYVGNNFNQAIVLVRQGKIKNIDIERLQVKQNEIWQYLKTLLEKVEETTKR